MRRSERRYVLILRSFSERSAHERPYFTVDPSGLIQHHALTLAAPIEQRCREIDMHSVVIGGGLAADAKADDVVIYLDYRDGGWDRAFRRLALGAAAIIVFPETTPVLISEIQHLRDTGLLQRTAFVAPPKGLPSRQTVHHDQAHFEARWTAVRKKLKALGLDAPPLTSRGCLFEFAPTPGGLWAYTIQGFDDGVERDWKDGTRRFLASRRHGEPLGRAIQDQATRGWRVMRFDPLNVPGGDYLLPSLLVLVAMIVLNSILISALLIIYLTITWLIGLR